MITMSKNLVEKVGNIHELMENFKRDMETIKRNQLKCQNENMVSAIKNTLMNLTTDY